MCSTAAIFIVFCLIFIVSSASSNDNDDDNDDRIYFPDENIVLKLSRNTMASGMYVFKINQYNLQ